MSTSLNAVQLTVKPESITGSNVLGGHLGSAARDVALNKFICVVFVGALDV
jgi:hypothetical protein